MSGMIAEVTATEPVSAGGGTVNWFDFGVVVLLLFGLFRGKRNGMSKELLPLLQWVAVVTLSAAGYRPLGRLFMRWGGMDWFWSLVTAYLALALVIVFIFSLLRRRFAESLAQSSVFRGGEYYLGMASGLVRYACVVLFVLALLNAPVYTPEEIAATEASDKQNLGGGLFQGNYFPHLFEIQHKVFKESFLGPLIQQNLDRLLVVTTSGAEPPSRAAAAKQPVIQIGNPPAAPSTNSPAK